MNKDGPPSLSVRQIILIGATLGCEAKRLICGRLPGVHKSAAGDNGLSERNGRGGQALAFRQGIPVRIWKGAGTVACAGDCLIV